MDQLRGECKFRSIIESLDSHAAIDLLTATCSCDIEVAALVTGLFRRRFENFAMTGGQTSSVIPQSAPQQPRTHQHSRWITALRKLQQFQSRNLLIPTLALKMLNSLKKPNQRSRMRTTRPRRRVMGQRAKGVQTTRTIESC